MSSIRTRFAPSPTGYLHVGGARTALFAWLYARHCKGTFILRVEDTDQERSSDESIQAILDGMHWLGLNFDEGPFYQMQRMDRYRDVIQQFLKEGKAYRCTCSKERLEKLREAQMLAKEKPRYDDHCRELNVSDNAPHVVRFKNPKEGAVVFDDLVRGKIAVNNAELDDLIIARTDGVPTYNFCVVVDDHDMKITDVIRGDDHINNTPRQINMLLAMGAQLPRYAHLPMILGGDGQRLSKRHGAVSVMQFCDDGYLPDALINYLARLGWSHGDQEIFSRDELISFFDLTHINNSPAAFNVEKLDWLNQHYMKTTNAIDAFEYQLKKIGIDYHAQTVLHRSSGVSCHSYDAQTVPHRSSGVSCHSYDAQTVPHRSSGVSPCATPCATHLQLVYDAQKERVKTLKEMAEKSRYFFTDELLFDEEAVKKHLTADAKKLLKAAHDYFANMTDWTKESLHQAIIAISTEQGVKMGQLAQPLRVAVTGGTVSPSIDLTLQLIGKESVLMRLLLP